MSRFRNAMTLLQTSRERSCTGGDKRVAASPMTSKFRITASWTSRSFMKERLVQDAVIRNFEVIGEAATRLSPPVHDRSRDVWSKVIAFRNRLIHGYWNVDLLLVLGRRRERPASFEDRGGQHTGRAF